MRILLVTPLYPPDISEPAPYVKELAKRLSLKHTVIVLTFGHIPEAVDGVTIVSVEKSSILPVRLFQFFQVLRSTAMTADVVYAQNGPSVELPLLVLTVWAKARIFFRLGDPVPLRSALTRVSLRFLLINLMKRVHGVVVHDEHDVTLAKLLSPGIPTKPTVLRRPLPRPEILPFSKSDGRGMGAFETAWDEHTEALIQLFHHD